MRPTRGRDCGQLRWRDHHLGRWGAAAGRGQQSDPARQRFAAAFTNARNPDGIEHSVPTLVGQRVFGLALGYQDINDHDRLHHDPMLTALMGKMTVGATSARRSPARARSTGSNMRQPKAPFKRLAAFIRSAATAPRSSGCSLIGSADRRALTQLPTQHHQQRNTLRP
jgi:hypothetical protein